jgi:hypothetical protein
VSPSGSEGSLPRLRDWLLIDAEDPSFGDRVVRDLTRLVGTPSGRALLARARASGRALRVVPPEQTDPPNAWIQAGLGQSAAALGAVPTECVIAFDPVDWPSPIDAASPASDVVLFALLHEACGQGLTGAKPAPHPPGVEAIYRRAEVQHYQWERGDV